MAMRHASGCSHNESVWNPRQLDRRHLFLKISTVTCGTVYHSEITRTITFDAPCRWRSGGQNLNAHRSMESNPIVAPNGSWLDELAIDLSSKNQVGEKTLHAMLGRLATPTEHNLLRLAIVCHNDCGVWLSIPVSYRCCRSRGLPMTATIKQLLKEVVDCLKAQCFPSESL